MIISRIIQNGLDLSIETNDIPYQRSANHKIQFVKDPNYSNYSLQAYGKLPKTGYQESEEFKLELEDGNYIKLPSAVFATKGIFQIAISLTGVNGDIINLGIVSYKIRKSFGDSTNILPDNEKAWNSFVHLEVDNYFNNTYQSKLNDFNTKYDDTVTKYTEIVETSTEVKKEYDEVVSMKKSVESSKQSIDNTKKQIDSTYDEHKKFANDTKIEINNAKQAIINGKNEINTLAKEKVDEYTQKVTDFNNNYDTKTASLDTKINEIQTKAVEIVETSTEQLKENIAESKNDAIKQIQSEGQSYQDQINELQKSEALQDEAINKLKDDVDLKVTQPYLNNNDSTHITSSDNGSLKNIVVKGNTVQNSTKGLNLINCTPKTTTINGITMVNNGDGTYTVNGIATDDFDIALAQYTTKQNIYYTLSGCPSGGSNTTYYLDPRGYEYDTGSGITIRNPNQDFSNYIRIVIKKGVTVNNLLFKPMFNEGQTAQPFEPYTGCQPSPSPDYPQKVKGVSEISGKIVGKNLFDYTDSNNFGGNVNKIENGVITTNLAITTVLNIPVEVGKTYILSFKVKNMTGNTSGLKYSLQKGKNTPYKQDDSLISMAINFDANVEYNVEVRFTAETDYVSLVTIMKYVYDVQLEYGQTATDYQPYQSQSFNYTLSKPLYRLSDSVYDYIDVDKGKIIRNVGVYIVDGSENWYKTSLVYTNHIQYQCDLPSNIEKIFLSNKVTYLNAIGLNNDVYKHDFFLSKGEKLNIFVPKTFVQIGNNQELKQYLQQNPITVYYQLATPVEELLPSDLQTLLQSLKTYYPQTNIMFDTEVEPYINFDYKLSLKSWIEDKDNKDIIYDKQNKEKDKYSSTFFENMFALQRTGEIYTVKFPKWETSHISTGEKLDANAGLVCEPSTKTIKGQNDYANIPLFKTYDVNAYVDDEGVRHVTAIKGDKDFKDEGKVDVFVLGMSYYEKVWEDDQYWYYSRTDSPRDGYTVARECINRDGSIQPFALYSKYVSGDIDGILYSSKGLQPARTCYSGSQLNNGIIYHDNSYNNLIKEGQKKGKFYSAGMICDYKYILTTFYLKYATLNSQSIMTGCVNYTYQYNASIQSEEKHTYFPVTKSRADVIEVNSYASVGYSSTNKSLDRSYNQLHRYGDSVKVLRKEAIDDNNVAIYLDVKEPFNTMPVTVADGVESEIYITSMHWKSGFSDDVLDRDGCPCDTKTQLINSKFPMVIQGIECMVGGYETYGNAFMDIVDATGKREVYIQNDASQLTTDMTTAKTTYKKSPYAIQPTKLNNWNYITRIDFDLENGAFVQTNVGQDGSSTTTGFADGVYIDNASSGQREFLGFGNLWYGSNAGLSCLYAITGVGAASWLILARLSINGVGGELTA